MSIIPPLHLSYQSSSFSKFQNLFYHVHNPTFTSVLLEPFKILSTMSIIPPLHPSYQKSFQIRSTMSIVPHLHLSYQKYSKVLPYLLSHLYIHPTRQGCNARKVISEVYASFVLVGQGAVGRIPSCMI